MNKRHLAVAVVSALALSSSTVASAEGGSHRRMGDFDHITSIGLSNSSAILTIDSSTAEPRFHFDTSTALPHIDFDTSTATTHFDDEPGVTDDGVGQNDSLSEDSSTALPPLNPSQAPSGLTQNSPAAPSLPSWITHAKSNDENATESDQSSEDSHD